MPFRRLDFSHDPATSDLRRDQAEHLRRALEEAGGGFVKMGQLLSTRDDLLPEEWTEGLRTPAAERHGGAGGRGPCAPRAGARCPGRPRSSPTFDPVPVAAASIAQVHRARLPDGTAVAVKVQRPGIDAAVRRDVDIALRVVRFMARWSTEARQVGVQDIAGQYADDLDPAGRLRLRSSGTSRRCVRPRPAARVRTRSGSRTPTRTCPAGVCS